MFCETKLHELEKKKKRDHFGIKREKKKRKRKCSTAIAKASVALTWVDLYVLTYVTNRIFLIFDF